MESQSPCQCLKADNSMQWLTPSSVPLKSDPDPPQQKLLLGARCLCNTKKDAKKGNLKMWFSVEGLQYSKMLLFLLSLPFIYSETGQLTRVAISYFCFFLQLFLQSKCMIKGQSTYVLKNKQHNLGFQNCPVKTSSGLTSFYFQLISHQFMSVRNFLNRPPRSYKSSSRWKDRTYQH